MPSGASSARIRENGTAWAFKGLCEFRLKNYDDGALGSDRRRARAASSAAGRWPTSRATTARSCSPASASSTRRCRSSSDFGLEGNDSPGIIEAMGLAVLRMPMLPADLPGTAPRAGPDGGAGPLLPVGADDGRRAEARSSCSSSRYPDTPNVHYAYGVFLLGEQPEKAIELFQRELKVSPQNVYAKLQIAFAHIRARRVRAGAALGEAGGRRGADRVRRAAPRSARRCSRPTTSRARSASSRPA